MEALNGRKKQFSGKRKSLNGKRIMTVAELELLRWAEEVTRRRKRKRTDEAPTIECEVDSVFSNHVTTRNNDEI